MKLTRHSTSATLEMLDGGVLMIRLAGPLTVDAMLAFKVQIARAHGAHALAFVSDFRRASLALRGQELGAILDGEPEDSPSRLPAALLARPEDLGMLKFHALRVASSHGVLRRVFSDEPAALAWARALARLPLP